MKVKIRIKQELLRKIKLKDAEGKRYMNLEGHHVTQDFQEMDIDKKVLKSTHCEHWMEVEKLKKKNKEIELEV